MVLHQVNYIDILYIKLECTAWQLRTYLCIVFHVLFLGGGVIKSSFIKLFMESHVLLFVLV